MVKTEIVVKRLVEEVARRSGHSSGTAAAPVAVAVHLVQVLDKNVFELFPGQDGTPRGRIRTFENERHRAAVVDSATARVRGAAHRNARDSISWARRPSFECGGGGGVLLNTDRVSSLLTTSSSRARNNNAVVETR